MEGSRRPGLKTLTRWAGLKCPACGVASIVARPFQIKHHCAACRALFKREDGFFVGALAINVVTTEFVILATYVVSIFFVGQNFNALIYALLALAFAFPVAFYHHAWAAWLTLDHIVESLPTHAEGGAPPAK